MHDGSVTGWHDDDDDDDDDDGDEEPEEEDIDDIIGSVLSLVVEFQVHPIMNFIWKLLRFLKDFDFL